MAVLMITPLVLTVIILIMSTSAEHVNNDAHTLSVGERLLSWIVHVKHNSRHGEDAINSISDKTAYDVGLHNVGRIGELTGYYVFAYIPPSVNNTQIDGVKRSYSIVKLHKIHKRHISNKELLAEEIEIKLSNNPHVVSFQREVVVSRRKRNVQFHDPEFTRQWHLVNQNQRGHDINVKRVWERNITGRGVTVAVVDDGLQWNNPDLHDNYNPHGSYDLNDGDRNPMPSPDKETNHHGTRCAGEISAVANSVCGVGVAYHAKVSGIRILGGPMTDSMEAVAFHKYNQINHIYSCSWGPDDDGRTVEGPHILAVKAMRYGVDFGRRGYGSIYIVASGNGGTKGDNCNFDGYANSIYTITIGAVDEKQDVPYYSEKCASMLAVTYSSGGARTRGIVTTDWTLHSGTGCTHGHSGTSAAAPIAAGLVALMLEAQPCLSWRDVQYIIALTATQVGKGWIKNTAGLKHSHERGFGLLDAWRLVNAARVWRAVPFMTSYVTEDVIADKTIPADGTPLTLSYNLSEADLRGYLLTSLEHVQVSVSITHPHRGSLHIQVICPSGTRSIIASPRLRDNSTDGFNDWTFSTVRCWGESPIGRWSIVVTNSDPKEKHNGRITRYQFHLYGTHLTADEFQSRQAEVEEAMSGHYLNESYRPPCEPPPTNRYPDKEPMTQWTLKLLLLISSFAVVTAVYESLEYLLCYNKEKKEHKRLMRLSIRASRLAESNRSGADADREPLLAGERDCMEMTSLNDLSYSGASQNGASVNGFGISTAELNHSGINRPALHHLALNGSALQSQTLNGAAMNGASYQLNTSNNIETYGAFTRPGSYTTTPLHHSGIIQDTSIDNAIRNHTVDPTVTNIGYDTNSCDTVQLPIIMNQNTNINSDLSSNDPSRKINSTHSEEYDSEDEFTNFSSYSLNDPINISSNNSTMTNTHDSMPRNHNHHQSKNNHDNPQPNDPNHTSNCVSDSSISDDIFKNSDNISISSDPTVNNYCKSTANVTNDAQRYFQANNVSSFNDSVSSGALNSLSTPNSSNIHTNSIANVTTNSQSNNLSSPSSNDANYQLSSNLDNGTRIKCLTGNADQTPTNLCSEKESLCADLTRLSLGSIPPHVLDTLSVQELKLNLSAYQH